MASIERTAYPRFKRVASARGLEGLLEVDPKTRRSQYDALKQPTDR